jgi:hypothetical protein
MAMNGLHGVVCTDARVYATHRLQAERSDSENENDQKRAERNMQWTIPRMVIDLVGSDGATTVETI